MNTAEFLSITSKIRENSSHLCSSFINTGNCGGNHCLDMEISQKAKRLAQQAISHFSCMDSNEANMVGLYAAYQEFYKSNNIIIKEYLDSFGNVDKFIGYFYSKIKNPML